MGVPKEPDVLVCAPGALDLRPHWPPRGRGRRRCWWSALPSPAESSPARACPYFDGVARKRDGVVVTPGIPLELLARMGVCETSDKVIAQHNVPIASIERFKIIADQLLQAEPNLRFLYHTMVAGVTMSGDRISEVALANKAGLQRITPAP